MKRRSLIKSAAAGVLALTLAACSAQGVNTDPTTSGVAAIGTPTIGLSYIPNIQFAPMYVAVDSGMFASRGVKATLRHHGANEGLFTALAAGQEDYVIAGGDEMMQARAEGMDLVAIASYYRVYPVEIIVPESSGITSLAGLKGKNIGVPGRYGESWFGLQVALKQGGLTEADVTITEIGYTQQAALTTGKVDAVTGYSNNDAVQFALAGFKARSLPLTGDVPLVSISLVTTQKELDAHPQVAKAVVAGMVQGIEAVSQDPEKAITISTKEIPGLSESAARAAARATLDATIKVMVGSQGMVTGRLDPAQWAAMATFMKDQGLLKAAVDPAKAMSTAYLP